MKSIQRVVVFSIVMVLLTACNALAPQPTATPTFTATLPPTQTPTDTPVPTDTPAPTDTEVSASATPEADYYYAPDKAYSLVAPEGWTAKDVGLQDPVLIGPKVNGFAVNINFVRDSSQFASFGVDFYSAIAQDQITEQLQNVKSISEDFLTTVDGQNYFRWEITDTQQGVQLRQVFYMYGNGATILVVTYTRPDGGGAENDDIVDSAMQTVRFE